jgi:hypothetical protein
MATKTGIKSTTNPPLRCSFCGKTVETVKRFISGPGVYICNECVEVCFEILEEEGDLVRGSSGNQLDLHALGLSPRFNRLRFSVKEKHCFYLCPFSEPFDAVYREHVLPLVEAQGFTIERADEIFGTQPIIEDIWEGIVSSSVIIADVSGRNPNVMYEIGMAHTVGKPVIIMTQSIDDVPFDLKHHRCIVYSYTPKGCKDLEEKLAGTLKFVANQLSKR